MDTLFSLIEAAGIDTRPIRNGPAAVLRGEIIDSNTSISKPSAWLLDALGGGSKTAAGIPVTPDSAMRQATVFACVNLLSDVESMLPLKMLRRMGDGSKEPDPKYTLYPLLHDAPNDYQSAADMRGMMQAHLLLRGNAYAYLVRDQNAVIKEIHPLHPDHVEVKLSREDRRLYYRIDDPLERVPAGTYPRQEVFHLRGLTFNGVLGVSVISYCRNTIGATQAAEEWAASLYANGGRPSGILSYDGHLTEQQLDAAEAKWREKFESGHNFRAAVLKAGWKWEPISLKANDAQFLETRAFQRTDIIGLFRIPPHMVGILEKSTSWGTGIEQQGIGFVTYTLAPWLTRWEQAISRQLISDKDRPNYIAEHNVAALLRGDVLSRYRAYGIGRQWGWLSVNDVLAIESRPGIGPKGDIYLEPENMRPAGSPPAAEGQPPA